MILSTNDQIIWLIPLIITHLIPFFLIPLIMWIFSRQKSYYEPKINSYLIIQLGNICLIIAMISIYYSHSVVQNWDQKIVGIRSVFTLSDGLFFIFMTTSFCLISYGLKKGKFEDILLLGAIILTPIGYFAQLEASKYIGLSIGLTFMTIRGYQVLKDKKIILFPVFSFGVNMILMIILAETHHPIFHVLHDVVGTLLGFAIFGYLFDLNGTKPSIIKILIDKISQKK